MRNKWSALMELAVLLYFQKILKSNNFLALTAREHVLILLKPDGTSSEGWISVRHVERQFEKYGQVRFVVKNIITSLIKEGLVEERDMRDQGADFAYYRLVKAK